MTTEQLLRTSEVVERAISPYIVETLQEFASEGGVLLREQSITSDSITLGFWVSDSPERVEQIVDAFGKEEFLTDSAFESALHDLETMSTPWGFVGEELTLIKETVEELFPEMRLTISVKDFSPCRMLMERRRDRLVYGRA